MSTGRKFGSAAAHQGTVYRLETFRSNLPDLADFNESSFEMYILRDGSVDLYMQDQSDQAYLISTLKLSDKTASDDPSSHRSGGLDREGSDGNTILAVFQMLAASFDLCRFPPAPLSFPRYRVSGDKRVGTPGEGAVS
jgi:hypothetical protein